MPENGLAKVEQIYQDRGKRVKELQSEGKKIFAYFCCYPPLEILTAGGVVPYRIMGDVYRSPDHADSYIEDIMCPYARSTFDTALTGNYEFCEGLIFPHSCDNVCKLYDIWRLHIKPTFSHFVNVPHSFSQPSYEFFEQEIIRFKKGVERVIQREITDGQISRAIELHNQNRALVRELYELKKPDPPLLSGSETMKTIIAVMSLPVEESNKLLRSVIEEVKQRKPNPVNRGVRVLVVGACIDDPAFIELVEECGGSVVADELCVGTRPYWHDVKPTNGPLKSLAVRYLEGIDCPRTYKEQVGTYVENLDNRFGHIRRFAEEFKVRGVIFYMMRFCDIFNIDFPEMKGYMEKLGFRGLFVEGEYTMLSPARLKTRVQAFLETLS